MFFNKKRFAGNHQIGMNLWARKWRSRQHEKPLKNVRYIFPGSTRLNWHSTKPCQTFHFSHWEKTFLVPFTSSWFLLKSFGKSFALKAFLYHDEYESSSSREVERAKFYDRNWKLCFELIEIELWTSKSRNTSSTRNFRIFKSQISTYENHENFTRENEVNINWKLLARENLWKSCEEKEF